MTEELIVIGTFSSDNTIQAGDIKYPKKWYETRRKSNVCLCVSF